MKTMMTALAAVAAAWCAGAADDPVNTVWNAQKARAAKAMPANAARVKALGATGDVAWFAVPAMSEVMRLADTWPSDGEFGAPVRCVLAQDEWEICSFQLFAFKDMEDVELKVEGIPFENDLRVVKLWFQNGNAWVSYFDDAGLKMTPELLLHDENLIKVQTEGDVGNWARVMKDGKPTYVWISSPKALETNTFSPYDPGFVDAPKLLPVALDKNAFKQFFLTLHPKKDQKPGVYKGTIAVTRKGEKLAEIPLAVRVLPFTLPLPRTYRHLDNPYLYGCMGTMPSYDRILKGVGGDEARAKKYFRAWLQSLYDHSIFNGVDITDKNVWCLPMIKEIGFPLDPMFGTGFMHWFGLNFGGRMTYEQLMSAKDAAEKCHEFYQKTLGHNNIFFGHGDEQGAAFVTAHREFFPFFWQYGIRIGCAGHRPLLVKGGYAYGLYPMAGSPEEAYEDGRSWYDIDPATPVGFYSTQHTGSENPQFTRRQHGLLGYLNGLSMAYNYEFATGPFNDRANECYKPMVITYQDGAGLMETIEYAGFREGCDDIRYATALKLLCREASEGKDVKIEAKMAARQALHYLALLDGMKMDLNTVRLEMIKHILKLRELMGK